MGLPKARHTSASSKLRPRRSCWGIPRATPLTPWRHGPTDPHPGLLAASVAPIAAQVQAAVWGYTLEGDDIAANHHEPLGTVRSGATGYEANLHQVLDQPPPSWSSAWASDRPRFRAARLRKTGSGRRFTYFGG